MKSIRAAAVILPLIAAANVAQAEIVSSAPGGFAVSEAATIKAPAKQVYAALGKIGRWWSSKHTGTGDAANMHLDLTIGGCFCERGPGGKQWLHMTVVAVVPNEVVRLRGALGPLQGEGVDGALTWTIKPTEDGVSLTETYNVGGYFGGGLDKVAPGVDRVMGEQLTRLKSFVETGSPDTQTK